jgi:uncharacterized protein (DUF342 family)
MNDENSPNEAENKPVIPPAETLPPLPVDAVIHVSISPNRLSAYVCIDPPKNGGIPATLAALEAALKSYKITYGIKSAKLKELADNPVYHEDIEIAQGIAPENGLNGTYVFMVRISVDPKPKINADGTVDYRDLGMVENVQKGQLLCAITLPTNGTEGMTVTGKKLLPLKGKAVPSFSGKNTELSKDGTAIYAKIDGQVEYDGKKINVNKTYSIKGDVDNSTGNLKVVGNVVISGTVFPQFLVEASGDIEIFGSVASATLKADGNIILHSGVIGSELSCKGNLTSKFIENCEVTVFGSIAADYIINSNIECGQSLQIVGKKGKLFGGSCVVGQDITARIIGSEAWPRTDIKIGMVPAVVKRQQELTELLPGLEKQIESLRSLIPLLQQQESANNMSPQNKMILDKTLFSYKTCLITYENSKQELAKINELISKMGHGKIVCSEHIFPGINITIDSAKLYIVDKMTGTSFYYNEDKICQGSIN